MNTRLKNGDRFPDLSISTVGGGQVMLPRDVEGFYSVILFYRGAWCPYCKAFMPYLKNIQADYAAYGAKIVAIDAKEDGAGDPHASQVYIAFQPAHLGGRAAAERTREILQHFAAKSPSSRYPGAAALAHRNRSASEGVFVRDDVWAQLGGVL